MLNNEPFYLQSNKAGAPACLLLHGLSGGSFEMQLLGEHLHRQGWTVRSLNYPGHERPAADMPASTWEEWYACVEESYLDMTRRHGAVSVVGFSTGCLLALYLAARHAVTRLVLLSPFMGIRFRWYYMLPAEVYLFSIGKYVKSLPRLSPPLRDPVMRRHAAAASFLGSFNLAAARSAVELLRRVTPEIPGIQSRVLIIQSRLDSVVEPAGAARLFESLGSARNELVWLERSEHIITLDVERDQVFSQVAQFLANAESHAGR